ncbi:hypothetical protein DSL72_001681 [Monilinia vaccinii-corymbosi]|uniref:DUF5672 domain-containing protein n=1 Tax=Monilinia vaccinii-corymbosi TaxID=61207 RepID=A0A8A3P4E0_9HELO|nr:hypothetical protein DSL72_001681 [Monilinia vaccinii-corymbosi]
MASPNEQASFRWYNRRIHRSFILAMALLASFMVVAYHQYDLSSISEFHLAKLASGSGAAGDSVTPVSNPSKNEHGTGKSEGGQANLKTGHPKTSIAPTGSKGSLASIHAELDPTRVALILETRPIPHLPALLVHFISILPAPWSFRFVGSPEAISFISSSSCLSAHVKSGKLRTTELPAKYKIDSQEAISATLTDHTFYKDFLAPAEWLLVFQSDSIICSASERTIEEWVSANWSWVGAPWNMQVKGGNGGLSLRHVPAILQVTEKEARQPGDLWEDRWITDRLILDSPDTMPRPEVEATFSVEGQWHDKPFGYHLMGSGKGLVSEIWDDQERRKHILEYCPEIKIILDMETMREVEKLTKEIEELKHPKVEGEKKEEEKKGNN